MYIEWTDQALTKITEKINSASGYLLLKYDTDGCGCVVDGVTALWLVQELDDDFVKVETNSLPIYVEKSKMYFLDDSMKIKFEPTANCFMLISPNQILNPRLSFYNKGA